MEVEDIRSILSNIRSRSIFGKIKRYEYMPYSIDNALNIVEGIGKMRNSRFVIDEDNRFTYLNFIKWIHGDSSMLCLDPRTREVISGRLNAGIYIAGNTGTGKSWCLEIMTDYCVIDNVRISISDKEQFLRWKNVRVDEICDTYVTTGDISEFKKKDILGIQDLGAEQPESMYMGNRMNVLQQILESRGDRSDKITLITSNLPINHEILLNRYHDRVTSRLCEMCNYFEIKGKDRRKNI